MRKRLVIFLILFFLVSISISYILSTVIFNLDSNSINYNVNFSEGSQENPSPANVSSGLSNQSTYILIFLFLFLIYLVYRIFYVELAPWFKMRAIKQREDPMDLIEFLMEEIKKSEKKSPSKTSVLVSRLKHFYEYLPEKEKKEALRISGLQKYINLKK